MILLFTFMLLIYFTLSSLCLYIIDTAEEVLIDCDNKKRQEISKQVIKILGKPQLVLFIFLM